MSTCARVVNIPGQRGLTGTAGTDGADGANAFTELLAAFTVPAVAAEQVAEVADTSWIVVSLNVGAVGEIDGQVLVLQNAGHFLATSIVDSTHVTLYNLGYTYNAPAGTVVPIGSKLGPGGLAGATGAVATGALLAANDLSDLNSAALARGNLGLGDLAILNTVSDAEFSGVLGIPHGGTGSPTAAAARTALGTAASGLTTASGLTVSATDRLLGRVSAGAGAVEEVVCTDFGQSLLAAATAAAASALLGAPTLAVHHTAINYAVTAADDVIIADTSAGAVVITLPAAAASVGKWVIVKKTVDGASNLFIYASPGETIDDAAEVHFTKAYGSIQAYCDGTEWWVVSRDTV